jgi:hypothetical protein
VERSGAGLEGADSPSAAGWETEARKIGVAWLDVEEDGDEAAFLAGRSCRQT